MQEYSAADREFTGSLIGCPVARIEDLGPDKAMVVAAFADEMKFNRHAALVDPKDVEQCIA
jgi:hypothetical protein